MLRSTLYHLDLPRILEYDHVLYYAKIELLIILKHLIKEIFMMYTLGDSFVFDIMIEFENRSQSLFSCYEISMKIIIYDHIENKITLIMLNFNNLMF